MTLSRLFNLFVLVILDIFSLFLSFFLGALFLVFCNGSLEALFNSNFELLYFKIPFFLFFFTLIQLSLNSYTPTCFNVLRESKRIVISLIIFFLVLLIFSFVELNIEALNFNYKIHDIHSHTSRIIILFSFVFSLIFTPLIRFVGRSFLSKFAFYSQDVIVFGAGNTGKRIIRLLKSKKWIGLNPVMLFDERADEIKEINGLMIHKGIDNASEFIKKYNIRYGILAIPSLDSIQKQNLLDMYADKFAHFIIIPDFEGLSSLWVQSKDIGGQLGLEIKHKLVLRRYQVLKNILDYSFALILLPLILPLVSIIAILIKLSSRGPIVYSQDRYGKGGTTFKAYKFRSMVPDADIVLSDYLKKYPELRDEWNRDQKLKNDPRITTIGKFLRKSSLDELPQIYNILKGDMSFVGPRPIVKNEIEKYKSNYLLYKRVKPGITGLWQVSGRNNTTYEERIDRDCYYVRNWSLSLDIYILFRTIKVVLFRDGAY